MTRRQWSRVSNEPSISPVQACHSSEQLAQFFECLMTIAADDADYVLFQEHLMPIRTPYANKDL